MALLRPAVCNKVFAFATNDITKAAELRTVTTAWEDTIDNYSRELWHNIMKTDMEHKSKKTNLLFDACCSDHHIDLLRNFIVYGGNIDHILIKIYKWSSISFACYNGSIEMVKLLLDAGVDINSKDVYGFTPLELARKYNHESIVQLLIERGAK